MKNAFNVLTMNVFCLVFALSSALAQTVIITDDPGYTIGVASAVLDVNSSAGGFLLPRMSMVARDAITEPATGLMVFQTDAEVGVYWNAGTPAAPQWLRLDSGGDPFAGSTVSEVWDIDGNRYPAVMLGGFLWMAENLRVTHYRNGEPVPLLSAQEWSVDVDGAMAYYDLQTDHLQVFGGLYNSYAATNPAGLCPEGWILPEFIHWEALVAELGGGEAAGTALRAALYWDEVDAANLSGFAALPAGYREGDDACFLGLRSQARWLTATLHGEQTTVAAMEALGGVSFLHLHRKGGFSVRCVKE